MVGGLGRLLVEHAKHIPIFKLVLSLSETELDIVKLYVFEGKDVSLSTLLL